MTRHNLLYTIHVIYHVVASEASALTHIQISWFDECALVEYLVIFLGPSLGVGCLLNAG